jgi:hypothetical protein
MPKFLLVFVPVLLIGLGWLVANSRAAVESPSYSVVEADGSFELRDYPQLVTAVTAMEVGGSDGGFNRLFRFISGGNVRKEKIAMTAPVLIEAESPTPKMAFILPSSMQADQVPAPQSNSVAIATRSKSRLAVYRFSSGRKSEVEPASLAALRRWMEGKKLVATGEPVFAHYDPPWTPGFMRRNEVMIPVASPK